MCRKIRKTLSILALLEADWSTAWGSQDDRGDDTHLVGDFAQAGFVQSNPCQLSQASCHQSDRSLPLLFKIAPVSCLASAWSTSCFEPGSTWGQEVREFPSSFTVESTWNPGCVRKSREGVVDRRWQMWFLLTGFTWTPGLGAEGDKTSWT